MEVPNWSFADRRGMQKERAYTYTYCTCMLTDVGAASHVSSYPPMHCARSLAVGIDYRDVDR